MTFMLMIKMGFSCTRTANWTNHGLVQQRPTCPMHTLKQKSEKSSGAPAIGVLSITHVHYSL